MKVIKQTVDFRASPHEVYEALMDQKKHSEFTGSPARISRNIGGNFSAYGGGIHGRNIELVPDRRIVQDWHCETEGWPEGHLSRVEFVLEKSAGGTLLRFTQSRVPDKAYEDIRDGWEEYYWKPMKAMFKGK
ncbi:MAG: SRPBCC family protein [Candidatus Micrarchaeia archaeon]